jgi:hypothetical protein
VDGQQEQGRGPRLILGDAETTTASKAARRAAEAEELEAQAARESESGTAGAREATGMAEKIVIKCSVCQRPLANGLDTFGLAHFPSCWDCYAEGNGQGETIYGLGPHHHDLSKTGTLIGSTVFDPLPEPNEQGEYVIDGDVFIPDPDAPGLGVWVIRPLPGWR